MRWLLRRRNVYRAFARCVSIYFLFSFIPFSFSVLRSFLVFRCWVLPSGLRPLFLFVVSSFKFRASNFELVRRDLGRIEGKEGTGESGLGERSCPRVGSCGLWGSCSWDKRRMIEDGRQCCGAQVGVGDTILCVAGFRVRSLFILCFLAFYFLPFACFSLFIASRLSLTLLYSLGSS